MPAVGRETLEVAAPTVSQADSLTTLYLTVTTSPILTSIEFCSGSKRQGSPPATLASERILSLRSRMCEGAAVATCVVPPKPVVRQNQLYSGTAAYAAPTMAATNTPHAVATMMWLRRWEDVPVVSIAITTDGSARPVPSPA